MKSSLQPDLFEAAPAAPPGLRYKAELISAPAADALVGQFAALPFRAFEFRGFQGLRRVVSYGWRYDFGAARLERTRPLPDMLRPLRDAAAGFAGLAPEALEQALITEYAPGAPIGWHRDRPEFGAVVGVSFLSACMLRFRRRDGPRWRRFGLMLQPRSAYLLAAEARDVWEHSIAPAPALRYSVTFRTLRSPSLPASPEADPGTVHS